MRRRDLLLGLGAGALLVRPFAPRPASAAPTQRRFLVLYSPNGDYPSSFGAEGSGADFRLKPGLAKAEPVKDVMSVVSRLSVKNRIGDGFHHYLPSLLSGLTARSPDVAFGPTIDQVIADLTGTPPLTLKVYNDVIMNTMGNSQLLSWRKGAIPNRNLDDPLKVYEAVFGVVMPEGGASGEGAAIVAREQSVLDFVYDDVKRFRERLSRSDDRERIDLHLESIRETEKMLTGIMGTAGSAAPATCAADAKAASSFKPTPRGAGPWNLQEFESHTAVMRKLMVGAFACGLRTAGTIMWQMEGSGINPMLPGGKADDHHYVSHGEGGPATWAAIDTYYSGLWNDTLTDLKTHGVLDDTLVVWASLLRNYAPADHSLNDLTFVVGGGKNLGIRYRQNVVKPESPSRGSDGAQSPNVWGVNDLWTTCLRACGGSGDFGEKVKGPIDELWSPT